jgi:tRNA dimethylallyltransferase
MTPADRWRRTGGKAGAGSRHARGTIVDTSGTMVDGRARPAELRSESIPTRVEATAPAQPPQVIAVFGPTASGKTAVAEALADRLSTDVVSADSMQVYRGLPILTNQPERPTRLVAIWSLAHEGSVGEYQTLAHDAIDELVAAGRTTVVAGGTGLYLRAALAELEIPARPAAGARERWESLYDSGGGAAAHALLAEKDPAAAEAVHPNDRRRVVRALELHEAGGSLRPAQDRLWSDETRRPTLIVGLDVPSELLAARIAARTRSMFDRDVEREVRNALAGRISSTARQVIGLREVASLPREEAIAAIEQRTRSYAAYQRKWLRRLCAATILDDTSEPEATADEILRLAERRRASAA